jgi:hypothetical protein
MITAVQQSYVEEHAYLPEHIVPYVMSVSQAEPFLLEGFLAYAKKNHLIFVGYPLKEPFEEKRMHWALDQAIRRFKPKEIALTAPSISPSIAGKAHPPSDHYYSLDLSNLSVPQKTRNMIRRAMRELSIQKVRTFGADHRRLVDEFLNSHPLDEATRRIFMKIPAYLSSVPTAWIFEVRSHRGELVAFDVAEFGSKYYAMYMFNFSSKDRPAPGASDLLLSGIINQSITEEKKCINLGLGINPGVAFFKTKWGGIPFLPYAFCSYSPDPEEKIETLLQKL